MAAPTSSLAAAGDSPRRSGDSCSSPASASSPEFEFWKFRNFSFSEHQLSTADELFVDGILLPFKPLPPTPDVAPNPEPAPVSNPAAVSERAPSVSKRWKVIFRLAGNGDGDGDGDEKKRKEKEKKKQYKAGPGAADLNINIWPFSRSRSAGTGPRPKAAAPSRRKASSAPCSRSNSGGESKSAARRLTPPSPARGVHVGRTSPVWNVRRRSGGKPAKEPAASIPTATGGRIRVLNLNVPLCMGYRPPTSCRSGIDGGGRVDVTGARGNDNGNGNGNSVGMFNLKTLFSRKVH